MVKCEHLTPKHRTGDPTVMLRSCENLDCGSLGRWGENFHALKLLILESG